MQAREEGEAPRDRWPTYNVNYRVRIQARDENAAILAFFSAVCGGDQGGHHWILVEDIGVQAVEIVNPEATFGDQAYIKVIRDEKPAGQEM